MKTYEIIKEEYVPCTGNMQPDRRERSVEFLATEHDGSPVIEALLEGGRKHRYIFSEI